MGGGESGSIAPDPRNSDIVYAGSYGGLLTRYDHKTRSSRNIMVWPDNPNGSPGGVAGLCDPTGRLFGLMPHPDAYLYPFQHPRWFRQDDSERASEGGGLAIFRNGVDSVAFPLRNSPARQFRVGFVDQPPGSFAGFRLSPE